MKIPEIRRKLFEFCCTAPGEVYLSKGEGVMFRDGSVEEMLYNKFIQNQAPDLYAGGIDYYTIGARLFGAENEIDLYYALSRPERGSERARRQRWLRRLIFRDLGLPYESVV